MRHGRRALGLNGGLSVCRESLPHCFVGVEPDNGVGKLAGLAGDEAVPFVRERRALGGNGRADKGHAPRSTLAEFALNAGAVTKRGDDQSNLVIEGGEVMDPANDLDAGPSELGDAVG